MRRFFIFLIFFILILIFLKLGSLSKIEGFYFVKNFNFGDNKEINILLLGKPGANYIGGENTDSILIAHYNLEKKHLILIPIPRDLVVYNSKNNLVKINSLYAEKEIETLLKKASDYSGLKIRKYIAFDIYLVESLVDYLGGLEVEIKEPVIDAVTFYTIYPGKKLLNGDLIELVLRSRHHPEGDFFRIKNQIEVIKALKDKIISLSEKDKTKILKFFLDNKNHWQTNLTLEEIYNLASIKNDLNQIKIDYLLLDTKNGFLTSNYFTINNTNGVYGIYPKLGIDNYSGIQQYLRSRIEILENQK